MAKSRRKIGASLRIEISLHLGLLLGAALLFSALVLLKLMEQQLVAQKVESLVQLTRAQAASLEAGLEPGRSAELLERFTRQVLDSGADSRIAVRLLDAGLNPLVPDRGSSSLLSMSEVKRSRYLDEILVSVHYQPYLLTLFGGDSPSFVRLTRALHHRSRHLGVLQLSYSLEQVRSGGATAYRTALLYAVGYAVVLLGFGFYQLNRRIVLPLKELMELTESVSRGELGGPVKLEAPREINALAEAFNRMVEALKRSRRQTQKNIASLETANLELKEARGELIHAEKMASVGHLAAGLAHEIGNPLGAVTGYLSLLKSELTDEAQKDLIHRSLQETGRIDRLIRELLDYVAPSRQEPQRVDPCALALEAVSMLDQQGAFKSASVRVRIPETLGFIRIRPHQLVQVFVNLLLNARDALAGKGTIHLSAKVEGETLHFNVRDDGPGMDEKVLGQIFDPFFSTKAQGEGRGLGLTICHRIVTEAGGRIRVKSAPGAGAAFELIFPLSAEEGCAHETG